MGENIVRDKSKRFAIRIVALSRYLQEAEHEYVLARQILRSGTSIGANIAEAEYAASRKDFLNKYIIALKETAETLYWLELLHDTALIDGSQFDSLQEDATELLRILKAITKKLKATTYNVPITVDTPNLGTVVGNTSV